MARDVERALLELGDFARVEPPAYLDQLVQQRLGSVLEQQRAALAQEESGAERWAEEPAPKAGLGRAEACVYALGFLAYGAQVADGLAQLIWRAMTG